MWIQLTELNGQPLALNTDHVVSVQAYGERTKILHIAGQAVVLESAALVLVALGLNPPGPDFTDRDPDQPLHS